MGPQHKGYHGPTTQWGYHKGKQGSVTVGPICTYLHLEELVAPRSEVVLVHIYPPVNALGPLEKLSADPRKDHIVQPIWCVVAGLHEDTVEALNNLRSLEIVCGNLPGIEGILEHPLVRQIVEVLRSSRGLGPQQRKQAQILRFGVCITHSPCELLLEFATAIFGVLLAVIDDMLETVGLVGIELGKELLDALHPVSEQYGRPSQIARQAGLVTPIGKPFVRVAGLRLTHSPR